VFAGPKLTFEQWHGILLGLEIELGIVAALMLFVATLAQRPVRERLLCALPFAAFVGMALLARDFAMQAAYWRITFSWLLPYSFVGSNFPNGYPVLVAQTLQDYAQALDTSNHWGWTAFVATEVIVLLSGFLLLRWYSLMPQQGNPLDLPPRPIPHSAEDDFRVEPLEPAESSEPD
jgi:hypothetical protein